MEKRKRKSMLLWTGAILILLFGLMYVALRGGYMPTPAFMRRLPALPPVPASTRDGRWQQAVEYLGSQLPYLHVNPYFKISEEEFQKSVTKLSAGIPDLKDEQIIVEIIRIVASIGDSHTRTYPQVKPMSFASLPLEMRWLDDGLIVIAASPDYEQVVGAKVIQIGEHSVEEVYEAVQPLIPADNDMVLLSDSPTLMSMPAILYGLNLIPQKDRATFGFEAQDGSHFSLELQPAAADSESLLSIYEKVGVERPLYERDRESFYWYQYLPESNLFYVQYNVCDEQSGKSFDSFVEEVFAMIDQNKDARLVLDVRFNGGGNESVLNPFIDAIKERPSLNTKGRLFVIVGRGTYSSALQNAITLSQETEAILIGEPTGGKPNHYGEVRQFSLPNVGLRIQYSTRYWLNYPGSDPLTLEPDFFAPVTVADLQSGHDPALDMALP